MKPETGRVSYGGRAFHQDASEAMRGDIVRALIETITNADDAYGEKSGKIRIETREYQGSNWSGSRRKYLVRWTDVPGVCSGCARSLDLRRYVADVIRQVKPTNIITHWKNSIHKDHSNTSAIVFEAPWARYWPGWYSRSMCPWSWSR